MHRIPCGARLRLHADCLALQHGSYISKPELFELRCMGNAGLLCTAPEAVILVKQQFVV